MPAPTNQWWPGSSRPIGLGPLRRYRPLSSVGTRPVTGRSNAVISSATGANEPSRKRLCSDMRISLLEALVALGWLPLPGIQSRGGDCAAGCQDGRQEGCGARGGRGHGESAGESGEGVPGEAGRRGAGDDGGAEGGAELVKRADDAGGDTA